MLGKVLSLLILCIELPALAAVGGTSGGGGKGLSLSVNGKQQIELLDLWEAKTLFKRTLMPLTGHLAEDVDAALVRSANFFPTHIQCTVNQQPASGAACVLQNLRTTAAQFLDSNANVTWLSGVVLQPTDDAYEIALPENCPNASCLVQIVNYQAGGQVWIAKDAWDQMDEYNQAALIVHETLYKFLRGSGETNSIRARRAVGYVFAGNTFSPAQIPTFPDAYLLCDSGGFPSPNRLRLYVDDTNSLVFAQNVFNNTALVGENNEFYQASISNGAAIYRALATNVCRDTFGYLGFTGAQPTGPVEFDRVTNYTLTCIQGQAPVLETSQLPQGYSQFIQNRYSCTEARANPAQYSILPSSPIVIAADTKDSNGNEVKGPWFSFRVALNNTEAKPITIVSLNLAAKEENSKGELVTKTFSYSPSQFNFTLADNTACNFTSFGTWNPGDNKTLVLENGIAACSVTPVFYAGSNESGVSGSNYVYSVDATPVGWYGTYENPEGRYTQTFTFVTQ